MFGSLAVLSWQACTGPQAPAPAPASPAVGQAAQPASPAISQPSVSVSSSPPAEAGAVSAVDGGVDARPAAVPVVTVLNFARELEVSVRSIGLGQKRMAVLSDEPWLFDRGAWKEIPLPERFQPPPGARQVIEIYFGRDDRPRLMGYWEQATDAGQLQRWPVYLRFKAAGWNAEWNEIGRLGGHRPGALYGVLGHADPEVVCKEDAECIIKRRTGWKTILGPPGVGTVKLCGDRAWGLFPRAVARFDTDRWQWVGDPPLWTDASGLWAHADGTLWVSVAAKNELHSYDGQQWRRQPSPIPGPRGLWASSKSDLWLVGEGGAAHYDGTEWRRAAGVDGPLSIVLGHDARQVWLAGKSGLWRGTDRPAGGKPDAAGG
jgi:hypothetical protein